MHIKKEQKDIRRWQWEGEWFLLLLPLFFTVHQYSELVLLVTPSMALELLGHAAAVSLLLLGTTLLVLRRFRTAALLTALLLFLYFFFGPLQDGLRSLWSYPARYSMFLPALTAIVVAATIYLLRKKPTARPLVRYLNATLLLLLLIDSARLIHHLAVLPPPPTPAPAPSSAPSVFLIVADEYAGPEVLRSMGYDNNAFMQALKDRGFSVAQRSRSNYNFTPYSIASLLQMDYLDGLEGRNSSRNDRAKLYPLINDNAVVQHFRKAGYSFVNLSPFRFAGLHPERQSGRFFLSGPALLRAPTLPARLDRDLRFALVTRFRWTAEMRRLGDFLWQENRQTLEGVVTAAADPAPRFVYAHLMMPHYPYLFNSKGQRAPPASVLEGAQADTSAYIEYLRFSNGRFLEMIDAVLKASRVPPVILFIGDHGFRHQGAGAPAAHAYLNFNAVYLPGQEGAALPDSISLVNEFRWVLNTAFGQALPYKGNRQIPIRE